MANRKNESLVRSTPRFVKIYQLFAFLLLLLRFFFDKSSRRRRRLFFSLIEAAMARGGGGGRLRKKRKRFCPFNSSKKRSKSFGSTAQDSSSETNHGANATSQFGDLSVDRNHNRRNLECWLKCWRKRNTATSNSNWDTVPMSCYRRWCVTWAECTDRESVTTRVQHGLLRGKGSSPSPFVFSVLRQVEAGDACRGRVQEPPTGANHLYGM